MSFGRLDHRSGSQPMSDINMTPLIDVMLVLVVIFILTAPLLASSIQLDLPRSDAAQTGDTPAAVTIVVDAAGVTYLNDLPVSAEVLAQHLRAAHQRAPDTEVQLRADQAVPYGRIVEVMGVAQQAGLGRIAFVADNRSAAGTAAGKP